MKNAFAFILVLPLTCFSETREVVVPNELKIAYGNSGSTAPFDIVPGASARYQQVYAGQQFTNADPNGIIITGLRFRVDESGHGFTTTISNIQINLSTIANMPDSLSPVFAANTGNDERTVFGRGPLSIRSGFPSAGLFEISIPLATPFYYQPTAGNLLMDVRNFSGGTTSFFDGENTVSDSISCVYAYTGDGTG